MPPREDPNGDASSASPSDPVPPPPQQPQPQPAKGKGKKKDEKKDDDLRRMSWQAHKEGSQRAAPRSSRSLASAELDS
uniref:Uncharacterized protein n=1 Tax=Oryza glumipatula TaxID=40148 RepID=A0A0E0ADX5_9ORYZ